MAGYVPSTEQERREMLDAIGVQAIDDLFQDLPAGLYKPELNVPSGRSELEVWRQLRALAEQNFDLDHHPSFLGAGAYRHFVPAVIGHLISRGEFLSSYTPYQPEISQGTLQSIYEWQSLVCELTGMDVSNASVYDAATGVGEAARMACAITRRRRVLVADTVHPLYRDVLATYTTGPEIEVTTVNAWQREGDRLLRRESLAEAVDDSVACLIIQQPNFLGWLERVDGLAERLRAAGAILVVVADPVSLGLLRPPGDYGAAIAVAEGKWTGGPLDFGGPLVGMFACKQEYVRQMPGRIAGATVDHEGRRGFVLTLATREQHIRREKATSNICTSEALIALCTTIYFCHLGKQGLREVAELCLQKSHYAAERIGALPGFTLSSTAPYFKEFVVKCPRPAAEVNQGLLDQGIIGGYDLGQYDPALADCLLLCCTELTTRAEIDRLVEIWRRTY
ncbi:MAG TPA: aminomethyl-transferring glycine dehydrogenase subunit GcvPA [Chloroflexota bacterium]|jgi:glycine dehydrogenase subunit 1|nr:aminomethyl-transferring glycine dehydrogenase subunit GcvPA [Chloroflexota bacterium]